MSLLQRSVCYAAHWFEFLSACRVFATVLIKFEFVKYFTPPHPTPPLPPPQSAPLLIHVSVAAVATGYSAALNQETRQDAVIVPSSSQHQRFFLLLNECV